MAIKHQLFRQTTVKGSLDDVWEFFSSPRNLSKITPPDMGFEIKTEHLPDDISEGMHIEYKVRPAFRIPTTWVSEISSVDEKHFFVDRQKHGPYRTWEHSHVFEEVEDGVLMTDHVLYELPGGSIGEVASSWVENRLNHIFDFRENAIKEVFK